MADDKMPAPDDSAVRARPDSPESAVIPGVAAVAFVKVARIACAAQEADAVSARPVGGPWRIRVPPVCRTANKTREFCAFGQVFVIKPSFHSCRFFVCVLDSASPAAGICCRSGGTGCWPGLLLRVLEIWLAVALVVYGALLLFCLWNWLFDKMVFEGICGRFGSFDGSDVCHIGSLEA